MKMSDWVEKKRELRSKLPEERLEELGKLIKKAQSRRVLIGILFEIRLARYIIYIKKLNPWRLGQVKPPKEDEEELSDLLEESEFDITSEKTLDEEIPLPKKEEDIIGKTYSTHEAGYKSGGYKSSRPRSDYIEGKEESELYQTKRPAHGFFGDRISREDEARMTSSERTTRELKEDIKYERNVKKDKKESEYHY